MRGRPRKFDEQKALTGAMLVFWEKGLAATSLDDLAAAMGMNRPSIYNAFGNKEDIYRKTLALFCGQLDQGLETLLTETQDIKAGLNAFFSKAIAVYCGNNPPMGCLAVCTAPSASITTPEVGEDLTALFKRLDKGFATALKKAQADGQVSQDLNPDLSAMILQGILQTIALRARSGTNEKDLNTFATYAVQSVLS